MSDPSHTRRRFLAIAASAVAGVAGGWAWLNRPESETVSDAAPTTTSPATTSEAPATTEAPTTTQPATTTTTEPPTTTLPEQISIDVICRDAWGAQPQSGDYTSHTISNITVHHTAVVLASNTQAPARARQHQEYHQSRGWPDLAYHYLIDANGHIYAGRPVDAVGDTGTDYDPTGHFLVCCEGDFNEQTISDAQYQSLVNLVAWGAAEFGVDPLDVRGHRDVATTSCPGDNLYPFVRDGVLADDVSAVVGPLEIRTVCGDEGLELVAAVEEGSV